MCTISEVPRKGEDLVLLLLLESQTANTVQFNFENSYKITIKIYVISNEL